MNSEQIINSHVLDILFENKNKAYGAYDLRRFYQRRLSKAIGCMLLGATVISAVAFIPKKKVVEKELETTTMMVMREAEKPKEKPKEKPQQKPQQPAKQQLFTSNVVIKPNSAVTDTVRQIDDNVAIGSSNIDLPTGGGEPLVGVGNGPSNGDPGPIVDPVPDPQPVFNPEIPVDNPDVQPQFVGGINALRKYLERNLSNPEEVEEGQKITVRASFVVGYDGKLKSFDIIQDGGDAFNKEVLRVLKKMPDWIPGKDNGRNVSVNYTIPVIFVAGQ